ncbi:MAG: hypothetical protein CL753_06950 [Chloroflexi bacterium]|nr:hypothetical protein [Chloroflexota bacterium]|tara:strand:- start:108 stop:428 length:321 start_codon:yes stop_codon:yes gene_type:complete
MKNECGKTRKIHSPYEVWKVPGGIFQMRVLKKYQRPDKEAGNPKARWYVAVKHLWTGGQWKYQDLWLAGTGFIGEYNGPGKFQVEKQRYTMLNGRIYDDSPQDIPF